MRANTRFLQESFQDVVELLNTLSNLTDNDPESDLSIAVTETLKKVDISYLKREIPQAIEQSLEGVDRVVNIVRAMKEFSHPANEKVHTDLNLAIKNTLIVATNEWKYVAKIETDFAAELPLVSCLPSEFNQVILNIIVNAAHATREAATEKGMGTITVSTHKIDDQAEIRISDTGCGMPPEILKRIFDPFFTTKEVGQGNGQGLNLAHDIIVNKHGGSITAQSEPGTGSCFIIRLPIEDPPVDGGAAD